jgi:hypothetical protein
MEFQRSKRRKHTSVAPPRLIELTLVARFQSPWTSESEEAAATQIEGRWHPSIVDFEAVANTPNRGFRYATIVQHVSNVGEMIARIWYKDSDEKNPKIPRPNCNLGRLNIITHGDDGVIALSGTLDRNGKCQLGDGDTNSRYDKRIDARTLEWFNTDEVGRTYRDMIREKLHPTAEIWLILCKGACIGRSFELARDLANTFGVSVRGYTKEVWYEPDLASNGTRIVCGDADPACVGGRNRISIGKGGGVGRGYFCMVKVPEAFTGKHMADAETFSVKNVVP